MKAPSKYEKQTIAMFDSFSKTAARNFCRNLKRVKESLDKYFLHLVEGLQKLWDSLDGHNRVGSFTPNT